MAEKKTLYFLVEVDVAVSGDDTDSGAIRDGIHQGIDHMVEAGCLTSFDDENTTYIGHIVKELPSDPQAFELAIKECAKSLPQPLIDVRFVSVWNNSDTVNTAAKFNPVTGEITDIEFSSEPVEGNLTEEYIVLPHGAEIDVCTECHAFTLKPGGECSDPHCCGDEEACGSCDRETCERPRPYIVNVCRIGYGHADIEVLARSEDEAEQLALDEAGGRTFSEHSSNYEVNFVREA